jgi:aryl-alcohol dehydrogenase (NADP+)
MKASRLGATDLMVSDLSLGTMTFGKEADEQTAGDLLDAFVNAGGTMIDTADRYAMGLSEEIIGRWLEKSGHRDRVILATKARFPMERGSGLHPSYLRGAIEDNLRRLNSETLDIFQPHAFDPTVDPSEWLGLLKEFVDEGKLRYLGASNFLGYQLQHTLDVAHYEGLPMVVSLQAQYNLLDRQIDVEILDVCDKYEIPVLAWSPLGGGWLTGKYRRDRNPTSASRREDNALRFIDSYDKRNVDRTYTILEEVRAVAEECGASLAQVSLAWLTQHPRVGSAIIGARDITQLNENLSATHVTLTPDQWSRLDLVSTPLIPDYPYGFMGIMGGR